MKIPVIINNRDLLTWPKAMVEKIKTYDNVGDIIIVDNGSTYRPLLEWYNTGPCTIISLNYNGGHTAPWDSGIVERLGADYYVTTDSDMGLDDTPANTLDFLFNRIVALGQWHISKIGLGLDWQRVIPESPYYNHMQSYEKNRWANSDVKIGVYTGVPIDTTFAMYKRSNYFIGGASTTFPYVARHYPWELTKKEYLKNEEFKYYIEHASNSSSYKTFLGL
jgi:glycosyltransferase involved in cell wall biosynthesis